MSSDGLLTPSTGGAAGRVGVDLDVRTHRFLRDHVVGGRALLSTVMGVETMAVAVAHTYPGARIGAISGIRVGPPYLLPASGRGRVEVEVADLAAIRCTVRSEDAEAHFVADVELAEDTPSVPAGGHVEAEVGAGPVVTGELVYGLYFHGPSFQVVDAAWIDGATLVARLRRDRPAIVDDSRRSLTAPLLVELCLQGAGLWDLAVNDAMTIPQSIDRIRRYSTLDADDPGPLRAVVRAVGDRFDAKVVDDGGRVHVAVDGYRTTPFAHAYDVEAAARIRRALGVSAVRAEHRPRLG